MNAHAFRPAAALLLCAALAGCGKSASSSSSASDGPIAQVSSAGAGGLSTKNTTRLGGSDPATDAAAVARAVYPGLTSGTRPRAVVLVDEQDWPAALIASVLASAPLGAPLLYSEGPALPAVSSQALAAMHPSGDGQAGGAQVIRIGAASTLPAAPTGYRTRTLTAGDPPALAVAVARLAGATHGVAPRQVIVLSEQVPPALAMPAAGLSAESGAPILLVSSTRIPAATRAELAGLHRPAIYLIGPSTLHDHVLAALARLGSVKPIGGGSEAEAGTDGNGAGGNGASGNGAGGAGGNPIQNAIAIARFADGSFGWGIHEPGHGLVFVNPTRPLDAPAAASLSANGDFGPLLLLGASGPSVPDAVAGAAISPALAAYLSDIKPAYSPQVPPVRSVYNHGWLIGDEQAISAVTQAEIDSLLEISPSATATEEPSLPLAE
ncbi:MAG TPA: hypothetical protein VGL54_07970 [Solirubrobacteraceae bacterium]|jgi:hypothetical protein